LTYPRREVGKRDGLSQRELHDHARVSFAKVAEYQKRGAVRFHAVIHIDGRAYEFKILATQVPAVVLTCVPEEDASAAVSALRDAGARAETREQPGPDFLER